MVDFDVIERRNSRLGEKSLVFGETPPRLEPCYYLAFCTKNERDAEIAGVPDEVDYVDVSGRRKVCRHYRVYRRGEFFGYFSAIVLLVSWFGIWGSFSAHTLALLEFGPLPEVQHRLDLPRGTHHLVDIEVSDCCVRFHKVRQIGLRSGGHPVTRTDEKGHRLRFKFNLLMGHAWSIRDMKIGVQPQMPEKEVPEFVGDRHELDRGLVVSIDEHLVGRWILWLVWAGEPADGTRFLISLINQVRKDFLARHQRAKCVHPFASNRAFRIEASYVPGKFPAHCIQLVIDKSNRAERPESEQRACLRLGSAAKTHRPVMSRGCELQAGLLNLKEHRVEWGKVWEANDEVEKSLVVLALRVKAGINEQLVQQGARRFDVGTIASGAYISWRFLALKEVKQGSQLRYLTIGAD